MRDQPVSPGDCRHLRPLFVQSHQSSGTGRPPEREHVWVCADCGQITVSASRGDTHIRVQFELATPRLVEAAGQYLRYLDADAVARALLAEKKILPVSH